MTIRRLPVKPSGYKIYSTVFWINERGKYGCKYMCRACAKVTLGMCPDMHFSFCQYRTPSRTETK